MLRETKENVQGTNSDAKETGTQINGVNQKEERNIQPEKNEATRIQKNEERNQDGSTGRHTAPPRTTRTDRESNSKGD